MNQTAPVRTKHIDSHGNPKFTNRLALESSPYLHQHAHNPVSWYPCTGCKNYNLHIMPRCGMVFCLYLQVVERIKFGITLTT